MSKFKTDDLVVYQDYDGTNKIGLITSTMGNDYILSTGDMVNQCKILRLANLPPMDYIKDEILEEIEE